MHAYSIKFKAATKLRSFRKAICYDSRLCANIGTCDIKLRLYDKRNCVSLPLSLSLSLSLSIDFVVNITIYCWTEKKFLALPDYISTHVTWIARAMCRICSWGEREREFLPSSPPPPHPLLCRSNGIWEHEMNYDRSPFAVSSSPPRRRIICTCLRCVRWLFLGFCS